MAVWYEIQTAACVIAGGARPTEVMTGGAAERDVERETAGVGEPVEHGPAGGVAADGVSVVALVASARCDEGTHRRRLDSRGGI